MIASNDKKNMALLQKFKEKIGDYAKPDFTDHYYMKWLKARNYDIDKAVSMFKTSMEYRRKIQMDELLKTYSPPEVLQKYLPGGFCGYDKEGSPVLIELYGYTDMKGILHSAKKSDIEKSKLLLGENVIGMLESQTKKLGQYVDGMTVIIDMDNVGSSILWGPGIQMYAHMGRVLQDNYPEIVKRTFIVNAPKILPLLWKMFRPLVTEEMKKKVCILGGSYKKELLKHIEASELPAFLGGTQTDPDGNPRCVSKLHEEAGRGRALDNPYVPYRLAGCGKRLPAVTTEGLIPHPVDSVIYTTRPIFIVPGGEVPESYYLKELVDTESMKQLTVTRADKNELRFPVYTPNSVLRWEFKTDGYDVGFGIDFESVTGRQTLNPIERVNSHMVPEDGTLTCTKTGTYIIVFDNSYSWARSKTVYYNVDVVAPDDTATMSDLDQVTQGGSWERIALETLTTRL